MKHTPGPWIIKNHAEVFPKKGTEGICVPYTISDTNRANARLIAAAPEMLAALERVLAWCDPASPKFSNDSLAAIVDEMSDVIAKARGGK